MFLLPQVMPFSLLAASSGDYQVPVEVYSETTPAQKEYVDYAYYATVLSDAYEVKIDPIKLVIAMQNGDPHSVQKLMFLTTPSSTSNSTRTAQIPFVSYFTCISLSSSKFILSDRIS